MKARILALAILYKKKHQRMLLQQRTDDAPTLPGYWALFGGHVEAGEVVTVAVARELLEEIEYRMRDPQLLFIEEYEHGDMHTTAHIFVEEYDESQPIILHEGHGFGWFTLPEVSGLRIDEHHKERVRKIASQLF